MSAGSKREFTYQSQVHCRSQAFLLWPIKNFLAPVMEESEDDTLMPESLSASIAFAASGVSSSV
jgi:hypothetical protein